MIAATTVVVCMVGVYRKHAWLYAAPCASAREGAMSAEEPHSRSTRGKTILKAIPILAIPVAVLGSIYGGISSPTEAAALGVLVVVFLGAVVYRQLRMAHFFSVTIQTAVLTGALMTMIFVIRVFSQVFIDAGVPFALADWLEDSKMSLVASLMLLNVMLLLIGALMDDVSGSVFAATLLLPVAASLGVDPLHFAAIVGVNLGLGNLTPPVAPLAFMAAGVAGGVRLRQFGPAMARMILFANVPVLILVTYVPEVVLWLPRSFGYL